MTGSQAAGRLLELTVSDLALIERLRLELAPGLNVFTGETGAGKSLLIDALGLATGARADTTLIRHGADVARVTALFDRIPEPLIASRDVAASGRSTARLDDEPVTATRLADVAGALVEVHGQHEQQRLLDERWQRDLLDAFGGHEPLRATMTGAVDRWRENRAALAELELDPRELARRLEIAEHEANEIAAARLRPGEATEIRAQLDATQHGEAIARGSATLHDALAGDERGARDRLAAAAHEARSLARLDGRFEALADRIAGLEAEVGRRGRGGPRAGGVRRARPRGARSPRGAALRDLRPRATVRRRRGRGDRPRRAGRSPRQTGCAGSTTERDARRAEDARLLAEVAVAAAALSVARAAAARALTDDVGAVLVVARLPGRRVRRRPRAASRPTRTSRRSSSTATRWRSMRAASTRSCSMLAPNSGEPPRPLARIASGGEMSRVALAIKQVLAEVDDTPTLVFDEVDTGHRRPERRPDRAQPLGAGPPPPGPVRDPPAADRGPRRRPLPDREAGARRPDRDRGPARSTRRDGSRSWRRCSAAARRRHGRRRGSCSIGRRRGRRPAPASG